MSYHQYLGAHRRRQYPFPSSSCRCHCHHLQSEHQDLHFGTERMESSTNERVPVSPPRYIGAHHQAGPRPRRGLNPRAQAFFVSLTRSIVDEELKRNSRLFQWARHCLVYHLMRGGSSNLRTIMVISISIELEADRPSESVDQDTIHRPTSICNVGKKRDYPLFPLVPSSLKTTARARSDLSKYSPNLKLTRTPTPVRTRPPCTSVLSLHC